MAPSRLEVQARFGVRSPSSVSIAVPAKLILWPSMKLAPFAGPVIVTVAAVFWITVTVIWAEPV